MSAYENSGYGPNRREVVAVISAARGFVVFPDWQEKFLELGGVS